MAWPGVDHRCPERGPGTSGYAAAFRGTCRAAVQQLCAYRSCSDVTQVCEVTGRDVTVDELERGGEGRGRGGDGEGTGRGPVVGEGAPFNNVRLLLVPLPTTRSR